MFMEVTVISRFIIKLAETKTKAVKNFLSMKRQFRVVPVNAR